jgi:hypothetical protein
VSIRETMRALVIALSGRWRYDIDPPGMVEMVNAEQTGAQFREIILAGGHTCHACEVARPDEMISVMSEWIDGVQYNRRYCVDRPGCGKAVAAQLDEARRAATQ